MKPKHFLTLFIFTLALFHVAFSQNCNKTNFSVAAPFSGDIHQAKCKGVICVSGELELISPIPYFPPPPPIVSGLPKPLTDKYISANVFRPTLGTSVPIELKVSTNGELSASFMSFVSGQLTPVYISQGEILRFNFCYVK
jgi:hypothetical protein